MDRTLILVKPDAFARNLTGEIIARFERKGLRIAALKQMLVTEELAKQHYAEHDGKPFFGELVEFITSGPIVAMVLEGPEAVEGRAPGDRRDGPARGHDGVDPRRLRRRGRAEHGSRVRLPGVRGARGVAVLPGARLTPRLTLASASPQRRAILEQLGVPFDVRPADVEERMTGEPRVVVEVNAVAKASAVPGALVLGADTIVAVDGATSASPATRRRPVPTSRGSAGARTPSTAGSRSSATARWRAPRWLRPRSPCARSTTG